MYVTIHGKMSGEIHPQHVVITPSPTYLHFIIPEVDLGKGRASHAHEGLPRPLNEPINRAAVDERGEHAAPRPE